MTRSRDSMSHLTSGRLLAHNTVWNLLGQLLPMAVGLATIPLLIRGIGVARFGILSLAWIVIGYFSLFDLGIGRALTKLVADRIGAHQEDAIPPLVWTSLLLMFLFGLFGGLITEVLSPWLVHRALKIPEALQTETLHSFYLLGISIPMITAASGLRGVLEALQHFRILNLIRIPMSIFTFVGPLLVLPFSHSLVPVIGVLVGGRLIGCAAHVFACFHVMPELRHSLILKRALVSPLLTIGGWMTVSNIVGPAILYLDRFLIGALLSLSAVAYYTVPFDLVSRLLVIPLSVAGVLFPAFAVSQAQDPNRTGLLLRRGLKYVFLSLFPIMLVIVTLAPDILRFWLGPAFAENGSTVLRWLAAGILLNSLTTISFAMLQGIGRADITGKLLLIDLPLYLAGAWMLVSRLGIKGAAIAWTGRSILEVLVFLALSQRFLPKRALSLKRMGISIALALFALNIATLPTRPAFKFVSLACALLAFVVVSWFVLLKPEERFFLTYRRSALSVTDSGMPVSATGRNDAV
jgi:O-antigen/teichoic acid export membrane protein